jgi:PrcB C-terminal
MLLRRLACSALLLAIAGCLMPSAPAIGQDIPLQRLRPDSVAFTLSGTFEEAGQFIARDESTWRDLWQRVHGRSRPVPPLPAVDFGQEMLVIAAMGRRTSGGYAIRLERAYRKGPAIFIVVRQERPGRGCVVPSALTYPVDIARLPASPDPVTFKIEVITQDCG